MVELQFTSRESLGRYTQKHPNSVMGMLFSLLSLEELTIVVLSLPPQIQEVFHGFAHVFEEPTQLPLPQRHDHHIPLK